MGTLHEKSPCCREKIIKYGQRRRQCIGCQKTWSVWQRKRGRKQRRRSISVIEKYFDNQITSLAKRAPKLNLKSATLKSRVQLSLRKFLNNKLWSPLPRGNLILLVDGLYQLVDRQIWTVYQAVVRSLKSRMAGAIILSPAILSGPEHSKGRWPQALDQILSKDFKNRIVALVCDGEQALISTAKKRGWLIQRCHFHLYMRIANYARIGPLNRNRGVAKKILNLVNDILFSPDEGVAITAVSQLESSLLGLKSEGLKITLRGLIKNWRDYRTYLDYPHLNLPTTTNSLESFFSSFREIQRKARGFRTISSFENWYVAFCKYKKKITCNGKNYQQK